jgi:hypothetical protein
LLIALSVQKCGFNHNKPPVVHKAVVDEDHTRFLQTATWDSIRIQIDYTTLDTQAQNGTISATFQSNVKAVLNQTVGLWQTLLKVKRTGKLKITGCDPKVLISSAVQNGADADLVIFPYAEDYSATDSGSSMTEAAAAYCAADPTSGRPVAGHIGYNIKSDFSRQNWMSYFTMLSLHEMTHVLAFADYMYETYVDANNNPIGKNKIVGTQVVNGIQRNMIISPGVVAKAKEHYGCSSVV